MSALVIIPTPSLLAAQADKKKAEAKKEQARQRLLRQATLASRAGNPRLAGDLRQRADAL